jgi:Zn finger protein HypA/HybF involved in hydrogenase expression
MVAKLNVFGIKLQNCRQRSKSTLFGSFHHRKKNALTHPSAMSAGEQTGLQLINLRRKTMEAYCVKCKAKREMKDPKEITMKNGRPATQGVCPTCGTKMFRIGKSK